MFLVRNVFHAKPGKAKELVAIFKKAQPLLESTDLVQNMRVLTDTVSTFWTVVIESEVEDLSAYMDMAKTVREKPEIGEAMKGYIELVTGGHREVLRIE